MQNATSQKKKRFTSRRQLRGRARGPNAGKREADRWI
jgi:hypothetical protein